MKLVLDSVSSRISIAFQIRLAGTCTSSAGREYSCCRLALNDSHPAGHQPLVYALPGTGSVVLPARDSIR